MPMSRSHFQLSFSLRPVLIVVTLVCVMRLKRIRGCDIMNYEFNNGNIEVSFARSPNGQRYARVDLNANDVTKTTSLFNEVSEWVKTQRLDGKECEHTIMLNKNYAPYIIVFKKVNG